MFSQLNSYFESNNLLAEGNHGGRRGHGTLSALSMITHKTAQIKEKFSDVAILTTNLSAAFDVIDHPELEKKLWFYGVSQHSYVSFVRKESDNSSAMIKFTTK